MTDFRKLAYLVVALASVFGQAPAFAQEAITGDAAAGEEIYQSVCRNCHGPTGKGMSAFPKLAGSEAEHLVTMLQLYRGREKIGPNSGLMWPVAEVLTDEDISNIVVYIVDTF